MNTLTPAPLSAVMRRRWETGPKSDGSTSGDAVEDAIRAVLSAVIDPSSPPRNDGYYQWPESDDPRYNPPHIGEEWIEELTAAVQAVGHQAFERSVVPSIISAIITRLPEAPAELVNHPDAEVLRADLARLEGQS